MSIFKVWIHVEEIDDAENYYEECGLPFDMGEFETEEEARHRAEELNMALESADELMAAAKDVIDTWEDGDLAGSVKRLEDALDSMGKEVQK